MANAGADVRIFEDLDGLSQAAADLFVESCRRAVAARGRALVVLSGGTTPVKLYARLAESPEREQVDWPNVQVFWGDERCVPAEDLENSYRQAHDVLLGHVPIPADNLHRIPTDLEPEAAALRYALVLKQFAAAPLDWPRFDLVLLGMGDDGHTASLFPGSPVAADRPTLAVTGSYQDRPASRITLTPPVINAARRVVFLVSGQSKSQTLANVLYGEYHPETWPAQRIRPADGELIWLVDQAAAGEL